jgi:hypothetical protein
VTPGVEAIELCRTRACDAPQRVAVGAEGRAVLAADLESGTWFWRVASPPGPLWAISIRKARGRSSRVHEFDANGDGLADIPGSAAILFGGTTLAPRFTPVPHAPLDAPSAPPPGAAPAPSALPAWTTGLLLPVGDVDGDGFDDAVLGDRVVRGAAEGFLAPARWLTCPPGGCGAPVGDINDDGYGDLARDGALQLGSPTGFRGAPAPVFAKGATVRAAPDVDGDGIADVAILSPDQRTLSVLRGGSSLSMPTSSVRVDAPRDAAIGLATGDINGDGLTDLVLLVTEPVSGQPSRSRTTVIVYAMPVGGDVERSKVRRVSWVTVEPEGPSFASSLVNVADVDGDGFDDILVFASGPHRGNVRVLRGTAETLHVEPNVAGPRREEDTSGEAMLSIGDVNGDGHDDVMIVGLPSVGYQRTFTLHLSGKGGLQPQPFATYTMGPRDRVPRNERQGDIP